MSLLETELYLDRATIPSVDAATRHLGKRGYEVVFFDGFDFADGDHSFWTPTKIDGRETGFDYHIISRAELTMDGELPPCDPEFGDTYLGFVARNHSGSILAAALAQLAICELTEAKGAFPDAELILENEEMIELLLETIKQTEVEINGSPDPSAHFLPSAVKGATRHLPENYFLNIGKAILGGAAAIGLAAGFILGMGHFFGPAANS